MYAYTAICLFVRLSAFPSVCLSIPFLMSTCLSACLPICLSHACGVCVCVLPACHCFRMSVSLSILISAFLSVPICLPCLPVYMPSLSSCSFFFVCMSSFAYLSICLRFLMSFCLYVCLCFCLLSLYPSVCLSVCVDLSSVLLPVLSSLCVQS